MAEALTTTHNHRSRWWRDGKPTFLAEDNPPELRSSVKPNLGHMKYDVVSGNNAHLVGPAVALLHKQRMCVRLEDTLLEPLFEIQVPGSEDRSRNGRSIPCLTLR